MEFFKKATHIDFMAGRRYAMVLSTVMLVGSLLLLIFRGLNLGVDFTGGTIIEVGYDRPAELAQVRQTLAAGGFEEAQVQHFGTAQDVLIRIAPREGLSTVKVSEQVLEVLRGSAGEARVDLRRVEFVGSQVGEELTEAGGMALLLATIGILIYVAIRFEYRMGVGAIVAMLHDPIVVLGWFALFHVEFDLTVLAAVLAVIGYSLNDTVVVFDRIRENFRKLRRGTPVEVVNLSVNQTLSRTLITSVGTLLAVVSLFLWGGKVLHGFSMALLVGIFVGTYSSIFVASPVALALGLNREVLMPPKKEEEGDVRP